MTRENFIELCRKSGVVDLPRLDAFVGSRRLPDDARRLAGLLVQGGLLTRFQAAQILKGKFRGFVLNGLKVLDQLGVGGMGIVYLCEQVTLKRKVAVKVLPGRQAQDHVARERFFREARAAAVLDHPNIIRIFDCASTNDTHYLMMEYVEGIDLQARIDSSGPLPVDQAVGYVIQAASGLAHAHERGLVHRDVKPSNLLLDVEGTVKVLDMGLARFFRDPEDNLTRELAAGTVVGTIDFLAPEQAIESSGVDARADLYSLGATLYALLSGKPPFGGTTTQKLMNHQIAVPRPLSEVRREVPAKLDAIVKKMMAKNPDERYQSAQEVIEALAPWSPSPTFRTSDTTVMGPRRAVTPRSGADATVRLERPPALVGWRTGLRATPRNLLIGGAAALALVTIGVLLFSGGGPGEGKPVNPVGEGIARTQGGGPKRPQATDGSEARNAPRAAPAEAAELLVNGSFEDGCRMDELIALNAGSAEIRGWVVTRGQIDYIAAHWQAADGSRSLDLHGSPGIGGVMQTFKTKQGAKYKVTLSLTVNPESVKKDKRLTVAAAGDTQDFVLEPRVNKVFNMAWEKRSWEFIAVADETTLEIYSAEIDDALNGPAIDRVSVVEAEK